MISPGKINQILRSEYADHAKELDHIFLTGNLQRTPPHPYFHDPRVEVIYCNYEAGDKKGEFHWHSEITEFEFVIRGKIGYREAESKETKWFGPGDFLTVPKHTCIQRIVVEKSETLTVKVASKNYKIRCDHCDRKCTDRLKAYSPALNESSIQEVNL